MPFAPLHLTVQQQQHCHDRLFQLLDRTLRSCDERDERDENTQSGSSHHQTGIDSRHWKQLKTQSNASLYIERERDTWRDPSLLGGSWKNPRVLLAVGTIDNSLDEVMFGLEVSDFTAVQVRSETLGKKPLDGAILTQFMGPTEADPFQFMGITWMVDEPKWPLNVMVHPRDFVIASATGVINCVNGERIGYEVVQSIDLPQCPPLPNPIGDGHFNVGGNVELLGCTTVIRVEEVAVVYQQSKR
ncbi:hypothetical protein JM18_008479 [Phytophthora kernoviae]|uniref:Uncharacterized protein n=2 Tax=Phytophthora kernoviae TaxID=325452 RepID=A0A921V3Q5_9STRA|nr:hypothetical protein G195_007475 [Phytophthora kernoviae 00238/432]KAG2513452.1 hypothetical protein JM18_008479 [Phytophthora kernoviae]